MRAIAVLVLCSGSWLRRARRKRRSRRSRRRTVRRSRSSVPERDHRSSSSTAGPEIARDGRRSSRCSRQSSAFARWIDGRTAPAAIRSLTVSKRKSKTLSPS